MNARGVLWMLGAVVLALCAAGGWLVVQRGRAATAEMEAIRAAEDELREAAARTSLAQSGQQPTPPSATFPPESARGEAPGQASSRRVEADREHIRVHVVDPDGTPVAGAELAVFRGESVLESATTDAGGVAHLKAGEGPALYALLAPGWALERGELDLAAPERTLVLADRFSIAGVAVVDGAPPKRRMELALDAGIPALPTEVFNALGGARRGRLSMLARTAADGTFAFRGLSRDESGTLHWEEPYFLIAQGNLGAVRSVEAAVERSKLNLQLVEGLELRFRVVDPAGAPVPGAFVEVNANSDWPGDWRNRAGVAGADGRFAKALLPASNPACRVEVSLADGTGARLHTLAWPKDPRGVFDVGDLVTGRVEPIEVLVQDEDGAPVANAIVLAWPPGRWPSRQTGIDGHATVELEFGQHDLDVRAFEFVQELVPVPTDAAEIVVRLKRPAILELEIPGPRMQRDLRVELSGSEPLFVSDPRAMSAPRRSRGEPDARATEADEEGRWKFVGLTPDRALKAVLLGPSGAALSSLDIAPLAPGERRVVAWSLADEGGTLRIQVLDPERRPLPHARVSILSPATVERPGWNGHVTGDEGELELGSIYGARVTLLAQAEGFAARLLDVKPGGSEVIEIVLERQSTVEVELVTSEGRRVQEEHRVTAWLGGSYMEPGEFLGGGRYRFEGLPAEEIRLHVSGPQGEASTLHDARQPNARLVVGEPGGLFVRFQRPADGFGTPWAVALAVPGESADRDRQELAFDVGGRAGAAISGLPLRTWEVWLERRSEDEPNTWLRVGAPKVVRLDAKNLSAALELQP